MTRLRILKSTLDGPSSMAAGILVTRLPKWSTLTTWPWMTLPRRTGRGEGSQDSRFSGSPRSSGWTPWDRWAAAGGEDVPAVEGPADGVKPVPGIGQAVGGKSGWDVYPVGLLRRIVQVVAEDVAEDAVVRGQETPMGGEQQQGVAVGAHAWVDNHYVNCAGGKETIAGAQNKCRLGDVLGANLVGEVDNPDKGVDAQGDALHNADIGVLQPEVGGQHQGLRLGLAVVGVYGVLQLSPPGLGGFC